MRNFREMPKKLFIEISLDFNPFLRLYTRLLSSLKEKSLSPGARASISPFIPDPLVSPDIPAIDTTPSSSSKQRQYLTGIIGERKNYR